MSLDAARIRADFPILKRRVADKPLIYLDNAATSQKPQAVIDALTRFYEHTNANVHRGVHTLSVEATDQYETTRHKIRDFINAPASECLIWTRGTTEGVNLVASSYGQANVKAGDNVVISAMEHHSDLVPWQQLTKRVGAELRYIAIDADGRLDLKQARAAIDKRTKIVATAHMSNVLGCVVPIAELADIAHKVGAILAVDAAQSVPHFPVDAQALDCDFMAFSAHKMLGPTGVGVLYGKRDLLEAMQPCAFGGDMIRMVTYEGAEWNDLPYKFEAGTPNIADVIATGVAVEYLSKLGMDAVWEHERELTAYALERFAELSNFTIFGPTSPDNRGGVISFVHKSIHPHDLGTVLDRFGIAIRTGHHCAMPLIYSYDTVASARASFYIYNTRDEVDALIDGLRRAESYFERE